MADIPEERSAGNASIPPQYIPVLSTKFDVVCEASRRSSTTQGKMYCGLSGKCGEARNSCLLPVENFEWESPPRVIFSRFF